MVKKLAIATGCLWITTLLLTGTPENAYHPLLIGLTAAASVITALIAYIERTREFVANAIAVKLGRRLDSLDEVLNYGITIGEDNERTKHAAPPTLLAEHRKAKHCPTDCECRDMGGDEVVAATV